jgi:hypothetical protein
MSFTSHVRPVPGNLGGEPNTKKQSKLNALRADDSVQTAPLGYLPPASGF